MTQTNNSQLIPKIQFIVVDDDPINNMICEKVIANVVPEAFSIAFEEPTEALAYLNSSLTYNETENAILLLDVNMPSMSGWEFMEYYEKKSDFSKQHLHIYILSSSVNPDDKEQARQHLNIIDFIEKPLTTEIVKELISKLI